MKRAFAALFGGLPERTRLSRNLAEHSQWYKRLLVQPTFFTVADSYPVELLFPIREGRSAQPVGKKGKDKGRWTLGFRRWWLLDEAGRVIEWDWLPLNAPDKAFNPTSSEFDPESIPLTDLGFRDAKGLPATLKLCAKGT